jgi:hypothetical protein
VKCTLLLTVEQLNTIWKVEIETLPLELVRGTHDEAAVTCTQAILVSALYVYLYMAIMQHLDDRIKQLEHNQKGTTPPAPQRNGVIYVIHAAHATHSTRDLYKIGRTVQATSSVPKAKGGL